MTDPVSVSRIAVANLAELVEHQPLNGAKHRDALPHHPRPVSQPFNAMLDDDGRTSLPVSATQISEWWIKIGADDWRQVLSYRSENGVVCYGITPSRLGLAERQRARRVAEAVQAGPRAAGRALQAALTKLDAADAGPARMLARQLQRWIEIALYRSAER